MQNTLRILITGCNRGLGEQLVQVILQRHHNFELYITSRNSEETLAKKWQGRVANNIIHCYQMDINDHPRIKKVVQTLRAKGVLLDFIVANAAVGYDGGQRMPSYQIAFKTLSTNVNSTIHYVNSFLPLLSDKGRVIVLASQMAALRAQPSFMRQKLNNPNITEQQLLAISSEYVEGAKKQQLKQYNFNWSAYGTSKAMISSWGRFVLKKNLKKEQSVIVMHPGWCSTDMGGSYAPVSPTKGAQNMYNCLQMTNIPEDKFYSENRWVSYFQCE